MKRRTRRSRAAKHRAREVQLIPLRTLPEIRRGTNLAALIATAAAREAVQFQRGDVLVLAQKVVSKAEGRTVELSSVKPSALAREWAPRLRQDPRLTEVVLRESRRILRMTERALIVETRHGFVCANAGVDRSNVPGERVTCLPEDSDESAGRISVALHRLTGVALPVIISDTFGRPWRLGLVNVAIGSSGLRVLEDLRGTRDAHGHPLRATVLAVADELAAAGYIAIAPDLLSGFGPNGSGSSGFSGSLLATLRSSSLAFGSLTSSLDESKGRGRKW
jgi:coenzyme F420-0:L-glutamate ligase/coenzyme F420-1:gamma-L-glutamate ligase